jgi:hypothetical protein
MSNKEKPINLGKYSDFIQVPKPHLRVKKKSESINVLTVIAHDFESPEGYEKKMKLYTRLNRVHEVLKARKLKFIKTWFAIDAISKALDELEKELGIDNL